MNTPVFAEWNNGFLMLPSSKDEHHALHTDDRNSLGRIQADNEASLLKGGPGSLRSLDACNKPAQNGATARLN
eukprot:1659760-Amphidinium_carterae.4